MELTVKDLKNPTSRDILNEVIHRDCIVVMKKMPAEIVDMVFFDPP